MKSSWPTFVTAALLLAACGNETPASTPTHAARMTPTPVPSATASAMPSTAEPTATPSATAGRTLAQVVRVVDGDTIVVVMDGVEYRVRYIGINTPETVDPRRPVECYGREASQRNHELVEGKMVELEKDVSETDSFGRLLRYVWLNGDMVNAILVREGYALASTYPPDVKYQEIFLDLEREAREAGRGLWTGCFDPSPTVEGEGICDYSSTGEPVIKGNISSTTGEKIYHVPGGEFYDKTVIDETAGERWFCTEQEAVDAGWRRSKQ
ncbi:MAG: thermonuclease family protein [Dehalococcoidia bacterium]|nr:thermonuclease family protein [Dehalococcoidia bacterium]